MLGSSLGQPVAAVTSSEGFKQTRIARRLP
jgi:hypothetical protein